MNFLRMIVPLLLAAALLLGLPQGDDDRGWDELLAQPAAEVSAPTAEPGPPVETDAAVLAAAAEPTILRWRTAGLPAGPYSPWRIATVPATAFDSLDSATQIANAEDTFRWIEHVSGPEACVFTAKRQSGALVSAGGGRTCPRSEHDSSCGYIEEFWDVFAASGGACTAYGVSGCAGICW